MSLSKSVRALGTSFLISGMMASSPLQQGRFSGAVSDAEGNPIPNATVVLCNEADELWFITSSDATGAFAFSELPANQFSIQVLSPQWRRRIRAGSLPQIWGYDDWTDSITLRSGQILERNVRLGKFVQRPHTEIRPCTPHRPSWAFGENMEQWIVEQTLPTYPQTAKDTVADTTVKLEAEINQAGKVISLRLLAPNWPPAINPDLTRAAVDAVSQWRYTIPPATQGQQIFEMTGIANVVFAR